MSRKARGRANNRKNNLDLWEEEDYRNESYSLSKQSEKCVYPSCTRTSSACCTNNMCGLHCKFGIKEEKCVYHGRSNRNRNGIENSLNLKSNNINLNNNTNNNNNNNNNNNAEKLRLDIWFSCREGRLDDVTYWIEEMKTNPNEEDLFHNTPLYYACIAGKEEIVKYLLVKGAHDDPVAQRCKQYSSSPEVIHLLDCYYNHLLSQPDEEKEKIIMKPLIRVLTHLRNHFNPPHKDSIRYQIEQLIPDDWIDLSNSPSGSFEIPSSSEDSKAKVDDLCEVNESGVANMAFQNALESYNELRKSREVIIEEEIPIDDKGVNVNADLVKKSENEILENCAVNLVDMLDLNICKICFTKLANCVNAPCGHLGFCLECMGPISYCPACRIPITNKIQVFHV